MSLQQECNDEDLGGIDSARGIALRLGTCERMSVGMGIPISLSARSASSVVGPGFEASPTRVAANGGNGRLLPRTLGWGLALGW